jgi:hypothetical protein
MTRPTRVEVNCTTGETSIIELTDAEIAQMEADAVAHAAEQAQAKAEAEAKATAKAALLVQLGITEEQAKLLLA